MKKKPTITLDEVNEMFHRVKESIIPTTLCKTITNSKLVHTKHGVIRVVTTTPIKY